jgi:hypothetical protein
VKKLELQPESDKQEAIRPTQLIFHSIVAAWTARRTYEFWRDSTTLESHFGVGYSAGDIAQYMGTETRADANYKANIRPDGTGAISAETASNSTATDPWNASQLEELIDLGVWAHETHGIPLRICRTHDDPGFGYHGLHGPWSVSGTACPGPARIKQFRDHVFPQIVARATGATEPQEESDMKLTDVVTIGGWIKARWSDLADGKISVNTALASGYAHSRAANENTAAIRREIADLREAVDKLTTTGLTEAQIDALAGQVLDRMSGRLAE